MRNLISFVHISLDGFVAGPNGEMDWIILDQEVFDHVGKRIGKTDAAMYGRVTYDLMESYWPTAADKPNATKHDKEHAAWYAQAHKYVLSNTLEEGGLKNTTIISHDLANHITAIKESSGPEILVFGSPSATHALLQLGLIDCFWFFVNPVVLGRGKPLFEGVKEKMMLQRVSSKTFACGVTELNYVALH